MKDIVFLSLETAGLGIRGKYEVLNIGMIDIFGKVLINTHGRRLGRLRWESAQEVYGIQLEDVRHAPIFDDLEREFTKAISRKNVVIWNARFVLQFIPIHVAKKAGRFFCLMEFYQTLFPEGPCGLQYAVERCTHNGYYPPPLQLPARKALLDARNALFVWRFIHGGVGGKLYELIQHHAVEPMSPLGRRPRARIRNGISPRRDGTKAQRHKGTKELNNASLDPASPEQDRFAKRRLIAVKDKRC